MLRVLTSVDYSWRSIWLLRSWVGASARLALCSLGFVLLSPRLVCRQTNLKRSVDAFI